MNFAANNAACVLIAAAVVTVTSFVWPESRAKAAQQPVACGPHSDVVKSLGDKFHEAQSATALTSAGTLLEVLTSEDGSTWTIIVTRPDGLSCVVAAGQNWQNKVPTAPETPSNGATDERQHHGYPGVGDNANLDPKRQLEI